MRALVKAVAKGDSDGVGVNVDFRDCVFYAPYSQAGRGAAILGMRSYLY
jgi:hypothetical protein